MKIRLEWLPKVTISKGSSSFFGGISEFHDDRIPEAAGIYVMARQHGATVEPVYIGKAGNLRRRIRQQFNNFRLMHAINDSKSGARVLLIGLLRTAPGQREAKVLQILEEAHIDAALTAGHVLVNKQGTKRKTHWISIVGKKPHSHPFKREMLSVDHTR